MINWSEIKTVLLDMDGTILDLSFDNYFWSHYVPQAYAVKQEMSFNEAMVQLKPQFIELQGTLNWYCLDYWSEALGLDIVALKAEISDRVAFREGAVDFLNFLKEQPIDVYLATNAHPKALEIKLLSSSFHHYFDDLISSHEFGVPKEDQQFWHALQERIGFDCESTLFIDDSLSVLNSAREFGIRHLFGIAQPDSQQQARNMLPYHALESFDEIVR